MLLTFTAKREKYRLWLEHEHDMYNEIMIECSESFEKCKSHLEKLVEM